MANYNSQYVGARIDEAVIKVLNPSTTPTSGSTELITSGAVADALALKADLNSPALTGTPTTTAPDASSDSRRIATTAFVQALGRTKAPLDSPDLQGTPTTTAPEASSNSRRIATTAFVKSTVNTAAAELAPLDSPAFTGNPTAPTLGTDSRGRIATIQYVGNAISERLSQLIEFVAGFDYSSVAFSTAGGVAYKLSDDSALTGTIVFIDFHGITSADVSSGDVLLTVPRLPPLLRGGILVAYTPTGVQYPLDIYDETVGNITNAVIKTIHAIPHNTSLWFKGFYIAGNTT